MQVAVADAAPETAEGCEREHQHTSSGRVGSNSNSPPLPAPRAVWSESDFSARVLLGVVDVQLERLALVRLDQSEQVLGLNERYC